MADQGRTNPRERALHLSDNLEDLNGTELSLGRDSTSYLDNHGGSFMSMLLEEPSPPITPAKPPTNPENGQNVAGSASTTVHGPIPIEPYSSSQVGNVSTTIPSLDLVLGDFSTKSVNTVSESDVHPHLTKTTTEPSCLHQPACGDSSSSDQHMTVVGSVANYEQAISVQPTPLQGFSNVNDRTEQMSQTANSTDNLQQYAHQSSLVIYQRLQMLCNLALELCESIDRDIEAQAEYIRNHRVFLEDDDEDINTVTEDETETETETDAEDENMDVDLEGDDFHDEDEDVNDDDGNGNGAVDQNRNEEATGNRNVNVENNIVGMQEGGNVNSENNIVGMQEGGNVNEENNIVSMQEGGNVNAENNIEGVQEGGNVNVGNTIVFMQIGGNVIGVDVGDGFVDNDDDNDNEGMQEEDDGLEVEDILAGLAINYYVARPSLDTDPPSCPICLEDFRHWDLLGILDCNHEFHYQCIGEWLVSKNLCPLCRNVGLAI